MQTIFHKQPREGLAGERTTHLVEIFPEYCIGDVKCCSQERVQVYAKTERPSEGRLSAQRPCPMSCVKVIVNGLAE
jgi:hypothetical protein